MFRGIALHPSSLPGFAGGLLRRTSMYASFLRICAPCSRSGRSVRSTLSSFKKVPGWEPIVELLKRHPVRLPLGVSPKDRQSRSAGCRMPTYLKASEEAGRTFYKAVRILTFFEFILPKEQSR
ncbi:MAG: hypothetical protein ABSE95_02560 [Thermodesulfobacteriota bacterium]